MPLCANCERLYIPMVSSRQAFEGSELAPNIHALQLSAKTCQLCNLFCHSLESVKLKGIKNGALKLFSWGSDAQGDPIGLSRIFVRIGDHVGRFVDVFTEPGNHASKVGIAIGRKLSVEYDFDLYRQWLSDCLTIHHKCANNKLADLPERFLEVTTSDGVDALRLVSHTQLDGHFAALSYCWGLPPFGVVTTKSSVKQHFNDINASKLSKTIQDAVQITRGLKIRYLWVDSLCIVQDDANDLRRESAKMEKVYQSAYVTIVAASAKGGSEGCLQLRRADIEPVNIQLTIPPSNELCILTFKLHSSSVSESFLSSPWNQRAWCLQEYALSRRILYFFSDRVVWQCKESFIAEDYAQLKTGRDQGYGAEPVISYPFFRLHRPPSLEMWFDVVETYSMRALTVANDKLIAIAGLANFFAPNIVSTYTFGHWLSEIHKSLLWISLNGKMQCPFQPRAPTWSWAALEGPIGHLHTLQASTTVSESEIQLLLPEHIDGKHEQPLETTFARHLLEISAPRRQVFRSDWTINAAQFNDVSSNSLNDLLYTKRELQCHYVLDEEGESCGWVVFDQEAFLEEEMFCIHLSSVWDRSTFQAHNILMVGHSTFGTEGIFRRIGAGQVTQKDFFDSCSSSLNAVE